MACGHFFYLKIILCSLEIGIVYDAFSYSKYIHICLFFINKQFLKVSRFQKKSRFKSEQYMGRFILLHFACLRMKFLLLLKCTIFHSNHKNHTINKFYNSTQLFPSNQFRPLGPPPPSPASAFASSINLDY